MKKSVILGTASDPGLRIRKVFQPALPKRFDTNLTPKAVTPNISPKLKPATHTRAFSYASIQTHASESSAIDFAQLPSRIQHLRGERSQALNDLMCYETLYDSKYSMHARLIKINSLCATLNQMTNLTIEAIGGESSLMNKLENGLKQVRSMRGDRLSAEIPENEVSSIRGVLGDTRKELFCIGLSGVDSIVTVEETGRVTAALAIPRAMCYLDVKRRVRNSGDILKGLHLKSNQGRLTLNYDSYYRLSYLSIIVSLEGVSLPFCNIIVEQDHSPDLTLTLSESQIYPHPLSTKIPKEKLEVVGDLSTASEAKMKKLLEFHLAVTENDGHMKMKWSSSAWDLRKRWFKGKIGLSISNLGNIALTTEETLRTYKAFDTLIYEGSITLTCGTIRLQLHVNEVLGLYRVSMQREDVIWVMKEEDDRDKFNAMTGLQFTRLKREGKTLFASLELRKAVSAVFDRK